MGKVAPYIPPNRDQGPFRRAGVSRGSVLTRCDNSSYITASGSGSGYSAAVDATLPGLGRQSLKMQPPTTNADYVQAQVVMETPLTMSSEGQISILVYVGDPLAVQTLDMQIYMSGYNGYMAGTYRLSEHVRNCWTWLSLPRSAFAATGGATADNWNHPVTRIILKKQYSSANAIAFWVGGVVYAKSDRPRLVLSFDGSYSSQYDVVLPKLQSASIGATLYCDVLYHDSSATYLTSAQVDEMYAAGLEVAWHGFTKYGGLDDTGVYADQATIEAQLNGFATWCRMKGYNSGIGHVCYPVSNPNKNASLTIRDYVIQAFRNCGIKTARLGADASSDKQYQPTALGVPEPYGLAIRSLTSSVSLATAKSWIDNIIARGETLHIYGHQFPASGAIGNQWNAQDFRDLIDYAVSKRDAGLLDIPGRVSDWWLSVGGS